ncbi:pituitary adenylate cyclase-activating polypeptide type I receptor [Oncorhynchus tshawytscha]|uniref:Pituitary adenylate cyclase-activating polypeptide type I receptor-like n=1 Tax=Oncorhynchus tshawytscha TaxID=74940 RepID=A0A8C8BXR9_ONCTS|nr:pituitary adenylate cyclase-activating polypeptide type I receptor [Oncorhynchus tshawytscha]
MLLTKTSSLKWIRALFAMWLHLTVWETMEAIHPDCALVSHHMKSQESCIHTRRQEGRNRSARTGCRTEWDEIRCWSRAEVGQIVNVSCSDVSQLFANKGYIFRNCTKAGWTELYPTYEEACEFADESETGSETTYFYTISQVYTVGYATSLVSLISAIFVFTVFRKFHCTRNYIHINLFSSFILRASAVFIKDGVLFADENLDHCFMSTMACKSAVAFFQFSILANYFWLLVEGMYLQTLLALTFVSHKKYFWWYTLIGWGLPTTILLVWVLTRNFYDNRGCWDDTDVAFIWWIIKGPITASLLVNFIIFINVIRILVQKLKSPGVGGHDTGHFMRLAKSTLFLIPLFGMHYMVFAFLPENTGEEARIFIELGLGSFQGFVVALLYCFLNGEVQAELKKHLWKWQIQGYLRYSRRRRTLFTESSTVTQISVLEKSSPKELPCISDTHILTHIDKHTLTHTSVPSCTDTQTLTHTDTQTLTHSSVSICDDTNTLTHNTDSLTHNSTV